MQTALAQFKKAYDEEQNSSDARIFYAIGLYYAGQLQAGDALLLTGPKSQGFGTVYVYDQRLMQVYANLKMNDRIIAIWKDRVAKNPKDAQLYIGLATAYYTVSKDVPNTIVALQQAIATDPNLAAQWQPIIQQLQSGAIKP
jgi:tetratricopeptide (TPR) repeat protein